ncbi:MULTISPECIES: flagellar biosynthetic protein FliO [unclassified Lebetimonas]|uniref:flagellar biosynthetic protein FliO n=1 Tax=unclassified Lebetimonas TaxID=2648158 RepID=UPI00046703EE|nr:MULTISPECIES: flagellar biosynthetic protein FliO [unclassified Lebetimonas]
MKKIIILFLACLIYGANLIDVNFFENKNMLDILFSLDSKFDGKIIKLAQNRFLIKNIKTDNAVEKNFNNFFVKSVIITPVKNSVEVEIASKNKYNVNVALTPDGYGIRFRIQSLKPLQTNLPTMPKENFSFTRYIVVVTILIILAIILLYLKKRGFSSKLPALKNDMKVLSQKFIDAKNKVVLFEYQNKKYLMLIGNTNILLDVFEKNFKAPKNEAEFDEMLKLNNKINDIEKYIKNADNIKELDETI